ncbi:MAG: Ig-like domain-containing protein, partial [Flavobacteriales bacterium]
MKTIKYILGVCLMISTSSIFAQGLQGIVVEKYYSTNAADAAEATANGAVVPLTAGSTVYRVYVDMAAGYEFSQIFGSPTHNLTVTSSANFFNDPSFGVPYTPNVSASNFRTETAWLDSYFTVGGVRNGSVGVLKSEDTDGSVGHATGLLANNAGGCFGLPITGAGAQDGMVPSSPSTYITPSSIGLDAVVSALDQTAGNSVVVTNGFLASLGGVVGATSSNMVLIGQFTTSGSLSFELNLQLINTATGVAENYVASNPVGGELTHPTLTYNSGIAPVVAITAPANGANVTLGSNVTISATASDAGGSITSVEFFVDGISVGIDATSPYSVSYNAAALGSRVITAEAIDNDCNETTSASRTINVVNPSGNAPANDDRANATLRLASSYPACTNVNGNLTNATNSPDALSSEPVGAGQDVWYRFVAGSNGARIQATSTVNDLVLELQTSAG